MDGKTRAGTCYRSSSLALPPQRISTDFDFGQGLRTALQDSIRVQHQSEGDADGAETWLDCAEGEDESDRGENADTQDSDQSDNELTTETSTAPASKTCSKKRKRENNNKRARKKALSKKKRNKKRQEERQDQDAFTYKPPIFVAEKLGDIKVIPCEISAEAFARAKGGWIARSSEASETAAKEIEDLLALGLKLVTWDGIQPMIAEDKEGRAIAFFAGQPGDPTWQKQCVPAIQAMLDQTEKNLRFGAFSCLPTPPGACKENRRGDFKVAAIGVSYGGGQTEPGNLKHKEHNLQVLQEFLSHPDVRRAMQFGSSVFAHYAPWLYKYYVNTLRSLFEHDRRLRRICKGSIFPAISLNFGPQAVSVAHKDHGNLADGLCWIMSCGNFNPRLGGHLILWELGLVVEFPPGASVLIPSAVITHENIGVQEDEVRTSITQYAAGGLFRWVEYGFRTEDTLREEDFDRWEEVMAERAHRWKQSLALYSQLDNIAEDRARAFAV